MLKHIKKWFSKDSSDMQMHVPANEYAKFVIMAGNLQVGELESDQGEWVFRYSNDFKKQSDQYNLIVGFPDINKEYRSDTLWPFFRIRIPGLKQPAVRQLLQREQIDQDNEVALLKRFGRISISNPYELEVAQ